MSAESQQADGPGEFLDNLEEAMEYFGEAPPSLTDLRHASKEAEKVPWYRSFRFWISAITLVAVTVIVVLAWPKMQEAFASLSQVNLLILALLIPIQLLSYYATGEVLFSFLRGRGDLRGVHPMTVMRMSLEFNFANHMLPSGGTAGIAYTAWKLHTFGVAPSRSTLGQLARFAVTFFSFSVLLVVGVIWLWMSGQAHWATVGPAGLVAAISLGTVGIGSWLLGKRRLLHRVGGRLTAIANWFTGLFNRARTPLSPSPMIRFLDGLHIEYRALRADSGLLGVPLAWSFLVNLVDASLFWVALWSIGIVADPALVFIAYGMATLTSLVVVTPNGLGAYELVMIGVLTAGGLPAAPVIAAVVLARVILMVGTIVLGYAFYQHSLMHAGKSKAEQAARDAA